VTAFWEIFLEYSWKSFRIKKNLHTILLRFMLKIWQKMSFKKNQIHLQFFLLFKSKHYSA
jgi:hypothetical protein